MSLYPLANLDDVIGGIHIPSDGYANAVDITQALAKGARSRGAHIFQDLKVTAIHHDGEPRQRRANGSRTQSTADHVVLCGGMWTRDLAAAIGVTVPLHACEHYYVLFQDVPGLTPDLPVLRDYDHCSYFKYDAGKLLVGAFEPHARPWGAGGIPDDFSFGEIAGDFSHFEPVLLDAMRRIPALEKAGIQKFFCGPESFTPDVRYHLGESTELAELLRRGRTQFHRPAIRRRDRQSRVRMDPRRTPAGRSVGGRRAAQHAVSDQSQVSAGPGVGEPRSAVCNALAVPAIRNRARRAKISLARPLWPRPAHASAKPSAGSAPNWYAPAGVAPRYEYSYGRQNWFEHSANEHRAVRNGRRPIRPVLVRKISPRRRGRDARAESSVRQRHRRGAGQDHLYAVAQRAGRHRGGSHRDALERHGLSYRQRARKPRARISSGCSGTSSPARIAC